MIHSWMSGHLMMPYLEIWRGNKFISDKKNSGKKWELKRELILEVAALGKHQLQLLMAFVFSFIFFPGFINS